MATQPYKAIVGALLSAIVAGLVTLEYALQDGHVTALEWVYVALAILGVGAGTGGAVYVTPNPPKDAPAAPTTGIATDEQLTHLEAWIEQRVIETVAAHTAADAHPGPQQEPAPQQQGSQP